MSDWSADPGGAPGWASRLPTIPGVADLLVIGRGGFGVVYRGHQVDLGRDVAVKVLTAPGADERALQLWRREVTAMGRLSNHPNIVSAFSVGVTDDGHPYLLMPYVPGGSLHDRIRDHGALPPADVVRIGSRLAGGLAAAHAAGVLHRDVKPGNVLLSEYGEPQLTDFGIARLVDAGTTTTGSVRATIGYAAPEVLGGEPATPATDVYGLGATLHAALAGQAPFAGTDEEAMVARIGRVMTQPPPDLRPLGVPAALAEVVEAALAKDPAARPQTAEDLRARLEAASVAPAAPPPPAATEVLRSEPPDRRPVLVVAAVAAAVVLVAALVAWALVGRSDDGGSPAASETSTTTTASSTTTTTDPGTSEAPAPSTTSPPVTLTPPTTAPSTTTTTTTEPSGPVTEADLRKAVVDYYDTVDSGDLEAGYALLSPRFQAAQPYDGYVAFWQGIESIEVRGRPEADAATLTVVARLRYVRASDGSTSDEDRRLTFVTAEDGTLLIDDDGPA